MSSKKFKKKFIDFLMFNEKTQTALIYESVVPRNRCKLHIFSIFGLLCFGTSLAFKEAQNQILNNTSKYCIWFINLSSFAALIAYMIYHKRIARLIKIDSTLSKIQIEFFYAFGKPTIKDFHINQISGLKPSSLGFHVFEIVNFGKLWIEMSQNSMAMYPGSEELIVSVLNGRSPK